MTLAVMAGLGCEGAGEVGGGPGVAIEGEGGVEERGAVIDGAIERVHVRDQGFAGRGEDEFVVEMHGHEGRDVHVFGTAEAHGVGGGLTVGAGPSQ